MTATSAPSDMGVPPKLAPPKPDAKSAAPNAAPPSTPPVPESYVVVLKPEKPLPLDHQVELTIASSLRGTGGPRPMRAPVTHTLRTHGALRFVDFYCPRIEAKGRCRANGDVKVNGGAGTLIMDQVIGHTFLVHGASGSIIKVLKEEHYRFRLLGAGLVE